MAKGRSVTGKKTTASKKSTIKPRAAAQRRTSRKGGYDVICSECYSEFRFTQSRAEKITCSECLHVGGTAPSDIMSRIALDKAKEQSTLIKAIIPAMLFMVLGFVWIGMLLGEVEMLNKPGPNWGFAGVAALLFIAAIGFAFKYEQHRYDVYF